MRASCFGSGFPFAVRDTSELFLFLFLQMATSCPSLICWKDCSCSTDVRLLSVHPLHLCGLFQDYFLFCSSHLLSTPVQCLDHCSLTTTLAVRYCVSLPMLFFFLKAFFWLVLVYIFLHPFTFKEKHDFWWGAENIKEVLNFKVKFSWPTPAPKKKDTNTPRTAASLGRVSGGPLPDGSEVSSLSEQRSEA